MVELLWYNIHSGIRSIFRLRSHTIISILGLVVGLACVFVISAWTIQELMFDRFHKDSEAIYMVTTDIKGFEGDFYSYPETPPPLAEALEKQVPAIESTFHFIYLYGGRSLKIGNDKFIETGIAVDSKFLNIFNFELRIGDPKALDEPGSIFLTEDLADKLFPAGNAIAENITYKNSTELTVRGILKNIPENSSLQFDFLIPYQVESDITDEWWQLSDATFIKTEKNAKISDIRPIAEKIWRERINDEQYNINFIPIQDLRYKAKFPFFNADHGNSQKLYAFIFVTILILLLACLNYINLVAAYASKRTKEVMIRKVNGAGTGTLIGYFLVESIILSILSWVLAIIVSLSVLHFFELILDVVIDHEYLVISYTLGFLITVIFVGILSGLYPAIISSVPMIANKSILSFKNYKYQQKLKNAFVLSQFVLSISLTIACIVIIRQTVFMSQFDVGYTKDNIIEVGFFDDNNVINPQTLRQTFMSIPEIEVISFAGASPINLPPIFATEQWKWGGLADGTNTSFYRINVDHKYLDVFQIPMPRGDFFQGTESDKNKIVINEKLMTILGFDDPIGQVLRQGDHEYQIIGVVQNFYFQHLAHDIQPLLMMYSDNKNWMFVKTNGDIKIVMNKIKNAYKKLSGSRFEPGFVSERYDNLYESEQKIYHAIVVFTLLTILLSAIGLIGLITYNTELKTKEIAMRKVLGAKISEIAIILNKGMIKWFLVAFAISSSLSWFAMNKWLENYAIKTNLSWWIFLAAAIIILAFTLLTVSFQTWKAAIKNPVEALKYE